MKNFISQSLRKFLFINLYITFTLSSILNAQTLKPALNQAILQAKQGDLVELPGFITNDFPLIDYQKIVLPGPQYLISDDPEYIRVSEAIAMQEAVQPGAVRLYVYNVNGIKEPKKIDRKITAVIKNTGTAPMHLRMLKYSSQKPNTDYYEVGQQGLADYFGSNGKKKILTIQPGEAIPIDKKLEKNIVKYDELVHGLYDFVIDQPGEISIIQTAPSTSGPEALHQIETVLPPKDHPGRGIFGVSNYKIENQNIIDTKNGAAQIIVADGKNDPWVVGKESTSGKSANLAGNYGVMYNMELKWKSSDGKGLALVTWNPYGGGANKWCGGMAASMVVSEGKFDKGVVKVAARKAPEAALIQIFPPAGNADIQTITIKYSPPGASCLPIPLILIPIQMKE